MSIPLQAANTKLDPGNPTPIPGPTPLYHNPGLPLPQTVAGWSPGPGQYHHYYHPTPAPPTRRIPKLRSPDPYNGSDPLQLHRFLAECINTFDNDPEVYQYSHHRVTFAASYLTGNALRWWQGVLLQVPPHPAQTDWDLFVTSLNENCGDRNIQLTAIQKVHTMKMLAHHKATIYTTNFREWMGYTGMNSVALTADYYRGLPE